MMMILKEFKNLEMFSFLKSDHTNYFNKCKNVFVNEVK